MKAKEGKAAKEQEAADKTKSEAESNFSQAEAVRRNAEKKAHASQQAVANDLEGAEKAAVSKAEALKRKVAELLSQKQQLQAESETRNAQLKAEQNAQAKTTALIKALEEAKDRADRKARKALKEKALALREVGSLHTSDSFYSYFF